ncbi:MAG: hypothetical protein GX557_07845, partial [Chloroflexi bacterium]|nr:hypothetical protein [Chloroflexota bacterium]
MNRLVRPFVIVLLLACLAGCAKPAQPTPVPPTATVPPPTVEPSPTPEPTA